MGTYRVGDTGKEANIEKIYNQDDESVTVDLRVFDRSDDSYEYYERFRLKKEYLEHWKRI